MSNRITKLLAIDDDSTWLEQVPIIFEGLPCVVHTFSNLDQGLLAIEDTFYDIVLLDLNFVGDNRTGLDFFRQLVVKDSEIDVIVISGETDPKRLVEIMNAGITNFIPKPASVDEIRKAVNEAIRKRKIRRDIVLLKDSSRTMLIGTSNATLKLMADINQAAKKGVKDIFIHGETGTGKELVARAISEAADTVKRFFPVHCAAINDGLVESELFGHVRGAFTGAESEKVGAFEAAKGGFVFLDEIGDMPLNQQAKLLRVLQERKVQKVGCTTEVAVSFKSISASHIDLENAVLQRTFREDLYYRIAKYVIKVPSLRDRLEDIPDLVTFFLSTRFNNKITITPQSMDLLFAYHWPGNIRQLESVVETMAYRCDGRIIREKDVCLALPEISSKYKPKPPKSFLGKQGSALVSQERKRFQKAIADAAGDRTRAAHLLNVSRATFFRRCKDLGITKPE